MRIETNEMPIVEVNFQNDTLHFENIFIGGQLTGGHRDHVSFYSGELNLGEMGVTLMTLLRGVIRITGEECGLSASKAEDFISFCLAEAVKREGEALKKIKESRYT